MEDFASILVRDYGLKPQGKSAPMTSSKLSPGVGSSRGSGYGSDRKGSLSGRVSGNASTFGGQEDVPYLSRKNGSNKMSGRSTYGGGGDDIFSPGNYDDVFGGPPKSSGAGPRYDDVFGEAPESGRAPVYDDLFGGLGVSESKGKVPSPLVGSPRRSDRSNFAASESAAFDELLPGFSSEPAKSRASGDAVASHDEDPFVPPLIDDPLSTTRDNPNSAPFIDPMDVFTVPPINVSTDAPRASSNASGAFDGFDIFDGFTNQPSVDASKPQESSQSSRDDLRKSVENSGSNHSSGTREQSPADETEPSERDLPTVEPTEAYNISSKSSPFFSFKSDDGTETTAPSVSTSKLGEDALFSSSLDSPVPFKARTRSSPFGDVKEKWVTVNDVKLVTKPSSIPPPSRPPPVPGSGRYGSRSRVDNVESSGQEDRFMSSSWPSANTASAAYANSSEEEQTGVGTPGGSRKDFFGRMEYKTNVANHSGDEKDVEEDAAVVKAREKERQEKERQEREAKEAEAREERERERARKYREKEREREKDRAAVQRVTLEARERAAQEARERVQRTAVERATTEARERAAQQAQERAARERAAVEKANAEARERAEQRAAMEKAAKERAEQRAAVERASAEARERAERAAVERAQAEARERLERAAAERAAQEARQRAAAEAREKAEKEAAEKAARREQELRRNEHELDAFFNPGFQPTPSSSEPKRSASVNNMSSMNYDPNGVRRSVNNSRPASVPSGDYLRSLLEDPVPQPTSNSGEDLVRNKRSGAADRSRDRAQKALEEIKKREAEMQREQAEKHRAADQLDAEIKRWAAGKEGNLRALLSTLQYVLWPECGWQPVSLSDLITAGSVKKTYRKATLVVHPDKVQQKGATVQHKYIAEKVFDLLKEAWNKFNAEELF